MLAAVVACVALLVGAFAGIRVWNRMRPDPYPMQWDERVQPIVDFVEDARDLEFAHPVPVEFLAEDEFRKRLVTEGDGISEAEYEELERFASTLAALGLLQGDTGDLLDAATGLGSEGILAYYDDQSERIVVKGEELDVAVRVTVAHELTHALQDQHFDLRALFSGAAGDVEAEALRALVEGDAVYTERAYVENLSRQEQDEYLVGSAREFEEFERSISPDVPEILQVATAGPYLLGPVFVQSLDRTGEGVVDEAFRAPPVTDEHIVEPLTFLDGDEPADVRSPARAAGIEASTPPRPFGALGWYYVLASRLDPVIAMEAMEGWGGDSLVHFERDENDCVAMVFVGDRPQDTVEMGTALDQWAALGPAGAARVLRDGEQITLMSCDPGGAGAPGQGNILAASEALVLRAEIFSLIAEQGSATQAEARCAATGLAFDPAVRDLLGQAQLTPEQVNGLIDQLTAAIHACSRAQT